MSKQTRRISIYSLRFYCACASFTILELQRGKNKWNGMEWIEGKERKKGEKEIAKKR